MIPAYRHRLPQWLSWWIWLNLFLHGFSRSIFLHLVSQLNSGLTFPVNFSWNLNTISMSNPFSGDAFAVDADILSCGAKRRSCLRVFFSSAFGFLPKLLHRPKHVFQEMCDVLILVSVNAFFKPAWFILHMPSGMFIFTLLAHTTEKSRCSSVP